MDIPNSNMDIDVHIEIHNRMPIPNIPRKYAYPQLIIDVQSIMDIAELLDNCQSIYPAIVDIHAWIMDMRN